MKIFLNDVHFLYLLSVALQHTSGLLIIEFRYVWPVRVLSTRGGGGGGRGEASPPKSLSFPPPPKDFEDCHTVELPIKDTPIKDTI